MNEQHPLTDELLQQIDAEEAWEKQHPLTDEICHQITWAVRYKTSDENDMRHAADWQLEQVIKWITEHVTPDSHYSEPDGNGDELWSYIITDSIIDDLIEAMRPQQLVDN